jgi:hypothetical protein
MQSFPAVMGTKALSSDSGGTAPSPLYSAIAPNWVLMSGCPDRRSSAVQFSYFVDVEFQRNATTGERLPQEFEASPPMRSFLQMHRVIIRPVASSIKIVLIKDERLL